MSIAFQQAPPSDELKWITIYPAYLNSKKTQVEGRRVPVKNAVDNPTCNEMYEILKNAQFNAKIENKLYPRDNCREAQFQGRVRVQLLNNAGKPVNSAYPTRKSIMLYLCETIPKLKTRQGRTAAPGPSGAQHEAAAPHGKAGGKKKR